MIEVREYLDSNNQSPFGRWFDQLDRTAAVSNVKGVGGGVLEYKIDYGPGYRVYIGRDGDVLVILLGGGAKKRQSKDIQDAKARWQDYKKRKLQDQK